MLIPPLLRRFAQPTWPTQVSHFMLQIDGSHANPPHGMGVGIDCQHTPLKLGTFRHAPEAPLLPEPPLVVAPLPAAPLGATPLALPPDPPSFGQTMPGAPQPEADMPIASKSQCRMGAPIVWCKGRSRHPGGRAWGLGAACRLRTPCAGPTARSSRPTHPHPRQPQRAIRDQYPRGPAPARRRELCSLCLCPLLPGNA